MLWIDLQNAIGRYGDNFTAQLFRLMLKADKGNLAKLSKEYPVEAAMVYLYHHECEYKDANHTEVDYEGLEREARKMVKGE